jgi:hypothetical protein
MLKLCQNTKLFPEAKTTDWPNKATQPTAALRLIFELSSFTSNSKMIKNIYLRIIVGANTIVIGLLLLTIYY